MSVSVSKRPDRLHVSWDGAGPATLDPVDVSEIAAPAQLFVDVQLGPLADLGPELAKAVATIIARLQDASPG